MTVPRSDIGDALKALVEAVSPDLRRAFRPSLLGKVVAVHEEDYWVDVVIGGDPETGEGGLALPDVPVSSLFAQDGYGIWALPEEGAEVTISFHDGDVTQPYVESPIYFRNQAPGGFTTGTIAIRGKQGQKVELKPDSNEIVISAGSVKFVTTDKQQQVIAGDEVRTLIGDQVEDVRGTRELKADRAESEVVGEDSAVAGSRRRQTRGNVQEIVGGTLDQQIAGGHSQKIAGGVDRSVTMNVREVIGGAYQLIVANAFGLGTPAYSVLVSNLGSVNFDALLGKVNIAADLVLSLGATTNIGSQLSGPVQLGGTGAIGSGAVYGPNLVALLSGLLAALKTSLQIGNFGAPTAPNPAFLAQVIALEAQTLTLLSSKVFVSLV